MTRMGSGKDGAVLEREYAATIIDTAHVYGWLVAHHPDSRRLAGDPGLPDYTLAHARWGVLFVETKKPGKARSSAQMMWHDKIRDGGGHCVTVYLPFDLPMLERILAKGWGHGRG